MTNVSDKDKELLYAGEELLHAWLFMSLSIRGNRVLNNLTFNEMAVCHILKQDFDKGGNGLTAAELCAQTKLLKSQMNKVISGLEDHGLLEKTSDNSDKRKVYLRLNKDCMDAYSEEHKRVEEVFMAVVRKLGLEKTKELALLIDEATKAAEKTIKEN